MKPKYRRFKTSLPVMITIALSVPCISNADIFNDDSAGNATPPPGINPETTIIADGPDLGVPPSNVVTINDGVNLNGQDDQAAVLILSGGDPYTVIVNSNGSLIANSDQDGINSTVAFTLDNSGVIADGGFNSQGIETVGAGTVINNNNGGSIFGADDAIRFTTDGGIVNNSEGGTITGDTGLFSDGVQGTGGFTVNNNGGISGNNDGVNSGGSVTVNNLTNFDPNFPFGPISGGSITGANNGISAFDGLVVRNENLSSITGTNAEGIIASNGADIENDSGATITGGTHGINVNNLLELTNDGSITGNNGNGVQAGNDADITNTGTITGSINGVDLFADGTVTNSGTITGNLQNGIFISAGAAQTFTLNNSGLVEGFTNSFLGSASDDTLNLNYGSQLVGNVNGAGGTDIINLDGGLNEADFLDFGDTASGPFSNSILGDILGYETINKTGMDVAFIGVPGDDGYTIFDAPAINVTGGGLYINADILGGSTITTSGNARALGGTGTWNANIALMAGGISAGGIPINLTDNLGESIGTLNLVGNVTHSPGTFIRHDLVPDGADDLINHSGGTYALGTNTDIRVAVTDNDTVIRNGTYTVVDSNSAITGLAPDMSVQFNMNVNRNDSGLVGSLTWDTGVGNTDAVINGFMSSRFTNGGTNLVFDVNHDFEGLAGLSSNASSLGAALDDSIDNSDPIIQDFIAALDYSDLGTVQATLESVIPDNVLGAATGIVGSNYRMHRVVEDHLRMTRSSGGTMRSYVGSYAPSEPAPQMTTSVSSMGNVWGAVSYDWRDSDFGGTTDFEGEDASLTIGVDYRVAPNLLLGILFDGTQSDYDYTGGSTDIDSYRFAVYGTYGESTGLYADFLVAYGDHDLDTSRSLGGILAGTSYSTSTDAESLQAMLTVGYTMQHDCVKHGPFAGLEYQNVDVDGFSPTGLGAFGGVSGFDIDSLRLLVGYRAEADMGRFTPFGSIAYAHEFEDGPVSATATIPGGATFRFNGGGVDSAVLATAGFDYAITDNLSASAAYHGEFTTGDGVDSHGATIGLNYSF